LNDDPFLCLCFFFLAAFLAARAAAASASARRAASSTTGLLAAAARAAASRARMANSGSAFMRTHASEPEAGAVGGAAAAEAAG
jgi:hypothetical protein